LEPEKPAQRKIGVKSALKPHLADAEALISLKRVSTDNRTENRTEYRTDSRISQPKPKLVAPLETQPPFPSNLSRVQVPAYQSGLTSPFSINTPAQIQKPTAIADHSIVMGQMKHQGKSAFEQMVELTLMEQRQRNMQPQLDRL
jgi:hypothetical protein